MHSVFHSLSVHSVLSSSHLSQALISQPTPRHRRRRLSRAYAVAVSAHAVAVAPYHHSSFVQSHEMPVLLHQPLVHVLVSGERHQRAPQEHELAKRRRTGEENPLPDIGIASMSQPILGVAVESESAGAMNPRN